jgi:hypothetical protein
MTNEPKFNAEQICQWAIGRISRYLVPATDACKLSQDESGKHFVFEFSAYWFSETKRERFTVSAAMIEDGVISEQQLLAALWHTLGKARGMA